MRDGADNCITVCNMENIDPWACTPATRSSSRPRRRSPTSSTRCCARLAQRHPGARHRGRLQHPVRAAPRRREYMHHRGQSARLAQLVGAGLQSDRLSDRRVSTQDRARADAGQIENPVTGVTKAAYEPALDYCVVKIPRWPFDKFPLADTRLGTQMKVDRRSDGHRAHVRGGADEDGARAGPQVRDADRRRVRAVERRRAGARAASRRPTSGCSRSCELLRRGATPTSCTRFGDRPFLARGSWPSWSRWRSACARCAARTAHRWTVIPT